MKHLQVTDSKIVWVAYTNTDCTEGRGYQIPHAVCESEATARRLGRGQYVMGANCPVESVTAVRVDSGPWLVPGFVHPQTEEDRRRQADLDAQKDVVARAKAAGLTDEDIQFLRRSAT